jgi:hypothetical protein
MEIMLAKSWRVERLYCEESRIIANEKLKKKVEKKNVAQKAFANWIEK